MEYSIEIAPRFNITSHEATRDELPRAYAELKGIDPSGIDSPTIIWNDGGEEVLIVGVNDKWQGLVKVPLTVRD
jgi:hypothetical protein